MLDYLFVCSFVKRDVCPRKIGKGLLQIVLTFLEYKEFLFAVFAARASPETEIEAKLERHVHAKNFIRFSRPAPTQIVHRIPGSGNKSDYPVQTVLPGFEPFASQSRGQSEIADAEAKRFQQRRKFAVKWAVDETLLSKFSLVKGWSYDLAR